MLIYHKTLYYVNECGFQLHIIKLTKIL